MFHFMILVHKVVAFVQVSSIQLYSTASCVAVQQSATNALILTTSLILLIGNAISAVNTLIVRLAFKPIIALLAFPTLLRLILPKNVSYAAYCLSIALNVRASRSVQAALMIILLLIPWDHAAFVMKLWEIVSGAMINTLALNALLNHTMSVILLPLA